MVADTNITVVPIVHERVAFVTDVKVLREQADRYRRLMTSITDARTHAALATLATECEAEANEAEVRFPASSTRTQQPQPQPQPQPDE